MNLPKKFSRIFFFRERRFFVLSESKLEYREIRFFRTRLFLAGSLAGLLAVGSLLIVNHLSNDVFGLGYNKLSLLTTENRLLKEQLTRMSAKFEEAEIALDELGRRGNDLRLMVDLKVIDEDTRNAGVGGSIENPGLAFVSGEANEILRQSQALIEQVNREVDLQLASYEQVFRKHVQNKEYFSRIPSIKPIHGDYSVIGFGMRVHPVLGIRRMHEGLDIITDVGTNVYASGDGVVRFAGRTRGGYGTTIEIAHGYGYATLYAHLSKAVVKPGQTVKRGELIALSGRTGLVSGPHLHYEVKYHGRKMNPVDYFFDDVDAASYRAQLVGPFQQ